MTLEKMLLQTAEWGVEVSSNQEQSLLAYTRELAGYKKANVVGTRAADEILLNHVLDSLSCLVFPPLNRAESLIDVGSGGGLPGMPLKIILPEMYVTLLEATGKKAEFLRHVVRELKLDDIEVMNSRAENAGVLGKFRAKYDVATIRAVAGLDVNCEYCLPLLREGGHMISMKSSIDEAEISAGKRAASLLGAEVSEIIPISFRPELPDKQRTLIVVRKYAETPERYPRKNGMPKKKPLGVVQDK